MRPLFLAALYQGRPGTGPGRPTPVQDRATWPAPPPFQKRAGLRGQGRAFGTFGELLQGALPDGRDFLVTLPIDRWSTATFHWSPDQPLSSRPAERGKSLRLAAWLLDRWGAPEGGTLTLAGDLPVGKGMASSSADLVATARAVGDALGVVVGPGLIEEAMRGIEPSDGVMYDDAVVFHHREVRLRARLGMPPPLTIVGVDEGGVVDTIGFNALPMPFTAADREEYAGLLGRLRAGFADRDLAAIGRVATRSAELNARVRPRPLLVEVLEVCRSAGGLGVVAAHSGTVLGVLLDSSAPDHARRVDRVVAGCEHVAGAATVDVALDRPGGRRPTVSRGLPARPPRPVPAAADRQGG
jgi:L-threonine kinase